MDIRRDWPYCQAALRKVSRTFSQPIEMMPDELRRAVTCCYLLCRIADTVEDHPSLAPSRRENLFRTFLDVVEREAPPSSFSVGLEGLDGDDPNVDLGRNLDCVLRVFRALDPRYVGACTPWVGELARGMALYAQRQPASDGKPVMHTLGDLERYCYFVAGTVGHMLTDAFAIGVGALNDGRVPVRTLAEEFGLGLQLTNILKDISEDWEQGRCFVPIELCQAEGIVREDLLDPTKRKSAHAALRPILDRARRALDSALEYALVIPPGAEQVRLSCLMPLWLAVPTLRLVSGSDDALTVGRKVKISREEVGALLASCARDVADDDALRAGYHGLWEARPRFQPSMQGAV